VTREIIRVLVRIFIGVIGLPIFVLGAVLSLVLLGFYVVGAYALGDYEKGPGR